MKISILLPYKENYSPDYPGAVSLFVSSMVKLSKFKKTTKVYGSTDYNSYLTKNYENISLKKGLFASQTKKYISNFKFKSINEYKKKHHSTILDKVD